MQKSKIPTHDVPEFRHRFMKNEQVLNAILRLGFERFFAVRVEEMFQQIRLPVPPMRAKTTSVIILTSGTASMQIGGEPFQIFENECLIVPTGQVFSFEKPDVHAGFLLHFRHDFLLEKSTSPERLQGFEFLQIWGNPIIRLADEQARFVHQIASHLLDDYQKNGLKNAEMQQACLFALLCELKLAYKPLVPQAKGQFFALSNQFRDLLHQNFRSLHLVSDYAKLLNITPNHLNKVVKTATSKSPIQWIDDCLLLEAKVLLTQTRLSVGEIAAEIGMSDASYFSRFFKKKEGFAPLEFRKMIEIS